MIMRGVKCQIFKFRNNSVVNSFNEISHADRGTINMKHIKRDVLNEGLGQTPWVDLYCRPLCQNLGSLAHFGKSDS